MKSFITFKGSFSAAHLYKIDSWTEQQNQQAFGSCYSQHGHGHNYKAEISYLNLPQELIASAEEDLKSLCQSLEHTHLNFDISFFRDKNPTTEMIALYFQEVLQTKSGAGAFIAKVKVSENEGLWSQLLIKPAGP